MKKVYNNKKTVNNAEPNSLSTSWNPVASWYDEYLQKSNTLQSEVVLPNLVRMLDIKPGHTILDVACGQGYFTEHFARLGATVYGTDISKELIAIADKNAKKQKLNINYRILPSHKIPHISDMRVEIVTVVLAFENIENVSETLNEINRVLVTDGRVLVVLMHPAFRIPQESSWGYDTKRNVQYRTVEKYLSEATYKIDMHPGQKGKKHISTGDITLSFHRSMQWYMKHFAKAGFAITKLEEWISHKESGAGPRKLAEDRARKEIPMFMCVELKKI
ncbi:MAG: class I SAM-dependent methyltransferase [Minisyncoccia bacterium]